MKADYHHFLSFSPELTPAQRAGIDKSFALSMERLQKLRSFNAPDVIICAEVLLIVKRAKLLYGDAFYRAEMRAEVGALRNGMGMCAYCPNDHQGDYGLCKDCIREGNDWLEKLGEAL